VIAAPTCPTPAFKLGEKVDDPLAMYLADIYTVTANLRAFPGISVPCGENHERLPIGLQLFARHFDEGTLLRVAHAFERAAVGRWSLVVRGSSFAVRRSLFALGLAACDLRSFLGFLADLMWLVLPFWDLAVVAWGHPPPPPVY